MWLHLHSTVNTCKANALNVRIIIMCFLMGSNAAFLTWISLSAEDVSVMILA